MSKNPLISKKHASKKRAKIAYPRGATVIIAMGLAMVMLVFSFGVATIIKNTTKNIKAFKNASQAQIDAMSVTNILKLEGMEGGYLVRAEDCNDAIASLSSWMATRGATALVVGAGQEGTDDYAYQTAEGDITYDAGKMDVATQQQSAIDANTLTFTCEVLGATSGSSKLKIGSTEEWYAVPTPGTGSAGTNCSGAKKDEPNDPCNWGVTSLGTENSTITVPLYFKSDDNFKCYSGDETFVDDNQDGVCDFAEVGSGPNDAEMELRVRAPCEPGSAACTSRYQFHVPYEDVGTERDKTIIYWTITGKCGSETCSLVPVSSYDYFGKKDVTNSEIYESLINTSTTNGTPVWSTDKLGEVPNAAPGPYPTIADYLQNMTKPTLQLLLVAPDMKASGSSGTIPYLEYQLRSKRPISTQETIYRVQINNMGQSYKIMDRVPNKGGVFNFTIQN